MEGLLIIVVIILVIIVFVMKGTNRRLDKNIQLLQKAAIRNFDADTEKEVIKLLSDHNYWSARKKACWKFGMSLDEFDLLYRKLSGEGKLKFKFF